MTATHSPALNHDRLGELADRLTGRLLLPCDDDYVRLATPWNVAVPTTPVAVVEAADADDVAIAVRHARTHGLGADVRCTGHGAVATDRPTLLIHTGLLDELHIDGTARTARVGAGVRWDAVLAAAAPHGLAPLAGSSPNVGVVGYLTGGGIGPVARTFGLASDQVTAFDVVTGDGVRRRAATDENPALFWALRGGKGALGIVTAVEMDLLPVREVYGGCLYFDGTDAPAVLHTWRTWAQTLPVNATSSVAVLRLPAAPGVPEPLAGKVTIAVRFAWVGDAGKGAAVIEPVHGSGTVVFGGTGTMPYAAIGSIHADPVDPMPVHENSTLLRVLEPETVDRLLALAGPDTECPQVIVELRHLGGALQWDPAHPSAFAHREAAYSLATIGIGVPPLLDLTVANAEAVCDAVAPWSTGGILPNAAAGADPALVARKYPEPVLDRLASLVTSYDPAGVIPAGRAVVAAQDAAEHRHR
jgi:hypothetical protein